jgi:DNA-binding transcriptional LysR family regulator
VLARGCAVSSVDDFDRTCVPLFASLADLGSNRRLSGKNSQLLQITVKNATLRQLKTFETVARRLSFSRAANELNLSPPAVSTQIKHLEEHAGVALFEQLGKKIYLTPAGREMLHHSRAIIHCFREAEETLAKMRNLAGGSLNVGVISTGGYFLPRLLAGFSSQNAGVELNLTVENHDVVLSRLEENRLDLAIMVGAPEEAKFSSTPFAPHEFVIVASPLHPQVGKQQIDLAELGSERFIVREKGSDTWNAMQQCFDGRLALNDPFEIRHTEAIKQAVISGMGISFLSANTVTLELQAGMLAVLDVVGFPVARKWHVVHRADKQLAPVAQAFKAFLLEEGDTHASGLSTVSH